MTATPKPTAELVISRGTMDLVLLWAWSAYLAITAFALLGAIVAPWHFPEETYGQRAVVVLVAWTLGATAVTSGGAMIAHWLCTICFLARQRRWWWLVVSVGLPFYGSTVAYLVTRTESRTPKPRCAAPLV